MRSFRSPLSWILVVAMLFAPLVSAAYACEREVAPVTDAGVVTPVAPAIRDCDEMRQVDGRDAERATPLCVDHCTPAAHAKADGHAPSLQQPPASLIVVAIVAAVAHDIEPPPGRWALPGLERPVVPLLPILFGRFHS